MYSNLVFRCFGAASAKERLDVAIRDSVNAGHIPGPRYLANGKEMARRDGELVAAITAYADGPEEMAQVINHHIKLGVDQIKLSMSGEEVSRVFPFSFYKVKWGNNHTLKFIIIDRLPKRGQHRTATLLIKRRQHV